MKKIYNNILSSRLFQPVIIALVFAGVLSSVSVLAADWQAPLTAPPACLDGNPGCDAPLHVGTAAQVKAGPLGVNGLLSAYNGISITTGYLGIGTAAASRPLHINMPSEDSSILLETQNTSAFDVLTTYRIAGAGGIRWNTGIDHSDANKFKIANGNTFNNLGTGDKVTISTAGNVGIGISDPQIRLAVGNDGVGTYIDPTKQSPTMSLSEATAGAGGTGRLAMIGFHNSNSSEAFIQLGAGGPKRFEFGDNQGGGAGLSLLDGGQLWIYEDKDCAGCAQKKGTIQFSANGNFHLDSDSTRATYLNWFSGSGGVYVGNGAQGYGTIRAAAFTVSSSRDVKTDITSNRYGLEDITRLHPVNFRYINDIERIKQIGLVAEDVNLVLPEVVSKDSSGKVTGIDYGKLTIPLINAVKELKSGQDAIQKEVDSLKQADGIILKAKGGTNCFELSVDDNGTLSTQKTECIK